MKTSTVLILSCLLVVLVKWVKRAWSRTLHLPPGPQRYPIIGNLYNIPRFMPWKTYKEWSQIYGDVFYMKIPNQHIVVLNSMDVAMDLLDKRSDVYSDRPYSVMNDLMGKYRWNLSMMRYSPLWREYRKEFSRFFNQHEVPKYRSIQLHECRKFLQRALLDPTHIAQHIRLIFSAIILKITFDMDVSDMDHEYIQIAVEAIKGQSEAQMPGKFWVDFFPTLKYMPRWIPGAHFKQFLHYYNALTEKMLNLPFDATQRDIGALRAGTSFLATLIERYPSNTNKKAFRDDKEDLIRNVTGLAFGVAADTTATAAQAFFVAMSLYPDAQRKAQEELDLVVGPNRLPEFDDYDKLVYIQAVILETLRWMPVTPLGLPHSVIRDDDYRGYLIPKGALIYTNVWAMSHDSNTYPNPEYFNPDRFIKDGNLNPDVRNPKDFTFGFGRRKCPGRWLSDGSLFMTVVSVLHTLNIHPVPGPDGKAVDPFNVANNTIKLNIENVPCRVTPRSDVAERLIHDWADLSKSY